MAICSVLCLDDIVFGIFFCFCRFLGKNSPLGKMGLLNDHYDCLTKAAPKRKIFSFWNRDGFRRQLDLMDNYPFLKKKGSNSHRRRPIPELVLQRMWSVSCKVQKEKIFLGSDIFSKAKPGPLSPPSSPLVTDGDASLLHLLFSPWHAICPHFNRQSRSSSCPSSNWQEGTHFILSRTGALSSDQRLEPPRKGRGPPVLV